jgi:hypothetical protein
MMKKLFNAITITVLVALLITGAAAAQSTPPEGASIVESTTSITPSTAFVGDTVTVSIDFTVAAADIDAQNVICLYFADTDYLTTINAIDALVSETGDTYTQTDATAINTATGSCPANTTRYGVQWAIGNPSDDAEFGDGVTFSFTVPSNANTELFLIRQRNAGSQVGGANRQLTISSPGSLVYVANDSATCGSNSPCMTGINALNQALDNVDSGGTIIVLGSYNVNPAVTADLTTNKTITLAGQSGSSVNTSGVCSSNPMIEVNSASASLTITSLTLDGTCVTGNRTEGLLLTNGSAEVANSTVRDFGGSGNAGLEVASGTLVVRGSTFAQNQTAMLGTGGNLYAFANNVTTNIAANAATGIGASDNVRCNYWGSSTIDHAGQYAERLGAQVVSYIEGATPSLGQASLASNGGTQVLINLGRSTSQPPFNNGTVDGLGALVSDFFAACGTRGSTVPGAITINGDNVTPGARGFGLFSIEVAADCSPADNAACWDYQNVKCTTAGCSLVDGVANGGHFVAGNQQDPTVISLKDASANSMQNTWLPLMLLLMAVLLGAGSLWALKRQRYL